MKCFNLPDMQSACKTVCTYILDGKSYNFQFIWCDSFFLMDIYILKSGEEKYLLKGVPVVANYNFLARINQPELISGSLYLVNKSSEDYIPTPDTISSDFELVYYSADE